MDRVWNEASPEAAGMDAAQGFHLGGNVGPHDMGRIMGTRSSPEAFGHNGNVCCSAWADPTHSCCDTEGE
jgi:hypothetical protein